MLQESVKERGNKISQSLGRSLKITRGLLFSSFTYVLISLTFSKILGSEGQIVLVRRIER